MGTIKELMKLTEAATPGPWHTESTTAAYDFHGFCCEWTIHHGTHAHYGWDENDARLAVAMRNALPALLDVMEAAWTLARLLDKATLRQWLDGDPDAVLMPIAAICEYVAKLDGADRGQ